MSFYISHKWFVFIAAVSVAFFDYGIASSFGSLYIVMLDTFNAGRAKTALVQSLLITFCSGFGVISGLLISRFGIKIMTYCAAVFTGAGFIVSYFAVSIYYLYGFISVILGTGSATMYVAAVLCVERSFSGRQKSIALSVQSIGTAISGFVWPRLLSISLESYSLRGTFLVLGGLFLNNIAFAIVFAETDQKSKTNESAEKQRNIYALTGGSDKAFDDQSTKKADDAELDSCGMGRTDTLDETGHTNEVEKINKGTISYLEQEAIKEWHKDLKDSFKPKSKEESSDDKCHKKRNKSNANKSNHAKNEIYLNAVDNTINADKYAVHSKKGTYVDKTIKKTHKNIKRTLNPLLCLYLTYTVAGALHMSTLTGFMTVYQDINISNGLSIVQSDLTFMVYSLFNTVSRFLPVIPAKIRNIHPFTIPIVSSLCGATGQMILLSSTPSITTNAITMAFSGIADGGWMSSLQAIIFDILPKEKQAVGFGFVLTAIGAASAATGPLFGLLRDGSTSYQTVLIITTAVYGASALLECLCLFQSKRLGKKKRFSLDLQARVK